MQFQIIANKIVFQLLRNATAYKIVSYQKNTVEIASTLDGESGLWKFNTLMVNLKNCIRKEQICLPICLCELIAKLDKYGW